MSNFCQPRQKSVLQDKSILNTTQIESEAEVESGEKEEEKVSTQH